MGPESPVEAKLSIMRTAFALVHKAALAAMRFHLFDTNTPLALLDTVSAPRHGELDKAVAPLMAKEHFCAISSPGAGLGTLLTSQAFYGSDARRIARTEVTAAMNEVREMPDGHATLEAFAHGKRTSSTSARTPRACRSSSHLR